jgi:hypothetical protein
LQIVYATSTPRFLEFHMADKREAVPAGSTIFAICTSERTIENQDEDLFNAITDEEYYELKAMIDEAERIETERKPLTESPLRKFFGWLPALLFGKPTALKSGSSTKNSINYQQRKIIPCSRVNENQPLKGLRKMGPLNIECRTAALPIFLRDIIEHAFDGSDAIAAVISGDGNVTVATHSHLVERGGDRIRLAQRFRISAHQLADRDILCLIGRANQLAQHIMLGKNADETILIIEHKRAACLSFFHPSRDFNRGFAGPHRYSLLLL